MGSSRPRSGIRGDQEIQSSSGSEDRSAPQLLIGQKLFHASGDTRPAAAPRHRRHRPPRRARARTRRDRRPSSRWSSGSIRRRAVHASPRRRRFPSVRWPPRPAALRSTPRATSTPTDVAMCSSWSPPARRRRSCTSVSGFGRRSAGSSVPRFERAPCSWRAERLRGDGMGRPGGEQARVRRRAHGRRAPSKLAPKHFDGGL